MLKYTLLASVLVTIMACSTSINTIETNKDINYTDKSDRLYIVVYKSESTEELMKKVSEAMNNSFDSVGVQTKIYFYESDGLQLNPELPTDEIQDYGPDALMVLGIEGGSYHNQDLTNLKLGAALFDPISQRIVWRAEIKSKKSIGFGGIENTSAMQNLGSSIVKKMREDELLDVNNR